MSRINADSLQQENPKKLLQDTTTDSGFFSGEQQLSGYISEVDVVEKVEADMTKKTTGNSADSENYTDSGLVSCSNLSSSVAVVVIEEVPCYVPEYLRSKQQQHARKPQHPTLNIEKYFEQDEDGYTKLHIAILHNIEPAINVLINFAEPAQLNIRNFAGQTALHLAVLLGMGSTVRKLIDAGADINTRDNRCNTPLHLAVLNNDMSCVQIITAAIQPASYSSEKVVIADLEKWNFEGESCFYVASKLRNIPIMRHLANIGANVNKPEGRSGYSPLHYAVETHSNDVIKFLCEDCQSIVNLDAENFGGYTAFQLGLLTNQESVADYLVKKGATPYFTPESDYEDEFDSEDDDENLDDSISSEYEKNQLVNKIAEIAVN
jgi:ankyrin repeat protein